MYTERFLMRRRRDRLSAEELQALEDAIGEVRDLPARHVLVRQGDPVRNSTLLVEGFMCRYMHDREGRRQLVAVHVPGDFVDLHAFPLEQLDHDVATLTPARVATIPRTMLIELMRTHPHLMRMLWFSTLLDAAMHREWIFIMGRLGAPARVAHLFCELAVRLRMVDLAAGGRFDLPITQSDVADACGLTPIHVNRVLRRFRERRIMTFRAGAVVVEDWPALVAAAEFDDSYLYVDGTVD